MNNNMYIIPANAKNGKLIFNIFRGIDLVVFLSGLGVSLIFFVAIHSTSSIALILKLLPVCICSFLVIPVAYYHNAMCFLKEMYLYLSNRRVYYWKGWCVRSEYNEK